MLLEATEPPEHNRQSCLARPLSLEGSELMGGVLSSGSSQQESVALYQAHVVQLAPSLRLT